MSTLKKMYGFEDVSYKSAGELDGITKLVNDFYDFMETLTEAKEIRIMHSEDLTETRKKLTYFLSGWMGGPRLYAEHYGSIRLPMWHKHLTISRESVEAWMLCMKKAIDMQPYDETFKTYLVKQLRIPANRIYDVCNS